MPGQDHDGRQLSIGAPATFVDHVRQDGTVVRLGSRRRRKHQMARTRDSAAFAELAGICQRNAWELRPGRRRSSGWP